MLEDIELLHLLLDLLKSNRKAPNVSNFMHYFLKCSLTLFRLGFLRVARLWGGGGVPAAYSSKTINDNEMKFSGVIKDH